MCKKSISSCLFKGEIRGVIKIRFVRRFSQRFVKSKGIMAAAAEGRVIRCNTIDSWNHQIQKGNASEELVSTVSILFDNMLLISIGYMIIIDCLFG